MQVLLRQHRTRAGFSLVDICVALTILAIALGTLIGTVFWAMRLDEINEETAVAIQNVRTELEGLNALTIEDVYAAYNEDPSDDPDPYHDYFADLVVTDPLLVVGKKAPPVMSVSFPADVADQLALNRLPITMRLEWQGSAGPGAVEVTTLLRNP